MDEKRLLTLRLFRCAVVDAYVLWMCVRLLVGDCHGLQASHYLLYRRKGEKDEGQDGLRKDVAHVVESGCPHCGHISAEASHVSGIEDKAGNLMEEETAKDTDEIALEEAVL